MRLNKINVNVKSAAFESAKTKLGYVKNDADKIIKSQDVDLRRSAQLVHKNLEHAFENVSAQCDISDSKSLGNAEYVFKERDIVRQLQFKLEAIFLKDIEPKPLLTSSEAPTKLCNVVKLQKTSCPTFSGSPRDFAQFKRNFNALVNVTGRLDVEIGTNLLNAIPSKYQYLLANLQLSEHSKMMDILQEKFGQSCLVVEDIVNQIEKMKPITTSRGFVEFVEKLERFKLHLETLGVLDQIATITTVGKLEARLPSLIYID